MLGIFDTDGTRLGTVARFAGNPADKRWVAWAIFKPAGMGRDNHRESFRLKRAAIAWLKRQRENHG